MSIRKEIYDLSKLNKDEARLLLAKLWDQVNTHTFNVDKESFCNMLLDESFHINKIQVISHNDKIIGYIVFRVIEKQIAGKMYGIIRFTSCVNDEYRGNNSTYAFTAQEVTKYYLSKLFTNFNILIFATCNSPASYYGMARYLPIVYPNPYGVTPEQTKELMIIMAESFDMSVDKDCFTTHYNELKVHETPEQTKKWQAHTDPAAKYYLKNCPNYHNGQSLILLVPITLHNLFFGIINTLFELSKKQLGIRSSSYQINEISEKKTANKNSNKIIADKLAGSSKQSIPEKEKDRINLLANTHEVSMSANLSKVSKTQIIENQSKQKTNKNIFLNERREEAKIIRARL